MLETDRPWSAYALGDLAPGFYEHSEWHGSAGPEAGLALLYRAFETPVLFTLGPPPAVGPLLDDIAAERALYLSIRPEILPLVEARWHVEPAGGVAMWRMVLDPGHFQPVPTDGVRRLTPADLPALEGLYADGAQAGEAPDFFSAQMVAQGVFYGLFDEAGALASAAGTHLIAPGFGVAAVGNVYTRRDQRGRGLAARVTSALAAALVRFDPPLTTIVLSVNQRNAAAQRVYERLGYRRYCGFFEGQASR